MKDSIHRYFQIGLVSGMAYAPLRKEGNRWPEIVRRMAADDYFDVVECELSNLFYKEIL